MSDEPTTPGKHRFNVWSPVLSGYATVIADDYEDSPQGVSFYIEKPDDSWDVFAFFSHPCAVIRMGERAPSDRTSL